MSTPSPIEQIELLLLSRNDYLPPLPTATSTLRAPRGPAASRHIPCEHCQGVGRVKGTIPCTICRDLGKPRPKLRLRHGCKPCWHCEGKGERPAHKNDEPWDAYTGKPLAESRAELEQADRDRGRPRRKNEPQTNTGPEYRWILERERYYRAGSYADLDRQLEWLARRYPQRHQQLTRWAELGGHTANRTAVDAPWYVWTEYQLAEIQETIKLLAARMSQPIRVPRWVRPPRRKAA